jgi:hypothetical protein
MCRCVLDALCISIIIDRVTAVVIALSCPHECSQRRSISLTPTSDVRDMITFDKLGNNCHKQTLSILFSAEVATEDGHPIRLGPQDALLNLVEKEHFRIGQTKIIDMIVLCLVLHQ